MVTMDQMEVEGTSERGHPSHSTSQSPEENSGSLKTYFTVGITVGR